MKAKILAARTTGFHETIMSIGDDKFKRLSDGKDDVRWFIENKGMYDEQNPANSASLEEAFWKAQGK